MDFARDQSVDILQLYKLLWITIEARYLIYVGWFLCAAAEEVEVAHSVYGVRMRLEAIETLVVVTVRTVGPDVTNHITPIQLRRPQMKWRYEFILAITKTQYYLVLAQ